MRIIKVDFGIIQKLAQECRCDRSTVSRALKGGSATVTAREIRALAIAKYGGRFLKESDLEPIEGEL